MEEYVNIPKRLVLQLLSYEDDLSSLSARVHPVVENCASTIREIGMSAGLIVEEPTDRPAARSPSTSTVAEGIVCTDQI